MWIVYVVNGAAFWLVAGEVYRVGKRDCHIVIENDRSISRTHLSIELGAPACLTSTQQQQQQQGTSCITPITLIDSSTYGTVLCAEGHRLDSTHSATPSSSNNNNNICVHSDVQQRVPALLHCAPRARCEVTTISLASAQTDNSAQVECCVCYYDENNSGAGRSGDKTNSDVARTENTKLPTHATGAEDDVAVILEQRLRLTKGTPLHIPVQLADWRVFSAMLGNHRATLRFVWWDATAMVQDVPCEMQTKLQHALAYCGVRVISLHDVPAQISSVEQRNVIVNAAEEGDEQLTLDEADTDMRAECNVAHALLPLCERYRDSTHASSQRPQTTEENSEHHFYHSEFPIQHSACVPHYGAVDYYVTSTLTPSITALAMLCRGVPIVAPSFFLALRQRCCGACSCATSAPPHDTDILPDMTQHLPTLHASWSLLEEYLRRAVPEASIQSNTTSTWQLSLLTQPQQQRQRQRRDLFAAWRFVLFQRSLYDEVRQYLPFTQAILCYDAQLQNITSQEHVKDREVTRQSVVLYSETEAPFMTGEVGSMDALLPSVEYAELMYCLLTMSSLHPHPLRHYATSAIRHDNSDEKKHEETEGQRRTSTRTSDGRRTDADPLFPDVVQRAGQTTEEEEDAKEKSAGDGRRVSRHGWITRHTAQADTVVMQDKAKDSSITHNNTSSSQTLPSPSPLLVVDTGQGTRELPAYPCFLPSTALTSEAHATNHGIHVPLTVRPFKKQKIAHGGPLVELVALEPSVGAAPEGVNTTTTTTTTIATRVPRVEAMDLLSEHVTMGPGPMAVQQQQQQTTLNFASAPPRRQVAGPQTARSSGRNATAEAAARFNSYDVAMHHALHRRRATRHMTEPHTRHPIPTATTTTSERNAERRTAVRHTTTTAVNDVDEEEDVDIGDEDVAEGEVNARQTSKGRRVYNIFDIDGLF